MFFLTIVYSSINAHPHHHSLAIFDYNDNLQQFEISLKFLTEDYKSIESTIVQYVNKNLVVSIDSNSFNVEYQGKQVNPENSWLYFTMNIPCETILNAKNLNIRNTLLLNKNPNQFNTIKLNNGKQQTVHNFSNENKKHAFNIKNFHLKCTNNP